LELFLGYFGAELVGAVSSFAWRKNGVFLVAFKLNWVQLKFGFVWLF
jgi:hypothetical protein